MLKTPRVKKPGTNTDVEARILGTNGPEWLLEAAWICKVESQQLHKLPYNKWIYPNSYTNWVPALLTTVQPGKLGYFPGLPNNFLW